jgi:hypothetical protein
MAIPTPEELGIATVASRTTIPTPAELGIAGPASKR